ncbi:unnamed protein product [Anisakis simplex]|uniref:Wings apart-like protein homolog (inferred by orthology to a human protein) n=1 Tax=Anisakis simplex TaxID=6269 RepID=A0A0M3JV11_ANISI|nr:unnamed protein product [Anisakis simplex]
MSSQSSGAKVTRRFGQFSTDPKADKAASLFDAIFPRQSQQSSSTANRPTRVETQTRRSSPKKPELPSEGKSNSPSSTAFSSPTSTIPDIAPEKHFIINATFQSVDSGSEDDENELQGCSQSSSASLNLSMERTSLSDPHNRITGIGSIQSKRVEEQKLSSNGIGTQKRRQTKISSLLLEEEADEDDDGGSNDDGTESRVAEEEAIPPQVKRTRSDPLVIESTSGSGNSQSKSLFPMGVKKDKRPAYKHKWAFEDDEEEEEMKVTTDKTDLQNRKVIQNKTTLPSTRSQMSDSKVIPMNAINSAEYDKTLSGTTTTTSSTTTLTRVRNVKEAHECLESGEHDDYRQDIDYTLSTLLDASSTSNIKCLSMISLAKKCVSAEFRQFFRTQNFFHRTMKAIIDSASYPSVAISASAVVYLMARDKICLSLDATSLRLLSQMLKMDVPKDNNDYNKYAKMVWDILQEWLDKTRAGLEHDVQFDFTEATISPSLLVLESLVYICTRNNNDQNLKNEMLNLGVLQWIVSKVDKTVLRLIHEKLDEAMTLQCLVTLERCFWILETCTVFNKKNQAYLISHRGSVLIQSCGRLMAYCHETVDRLGDKDSALVKANITCLCRISGILTNLSHENELCSTKLGQMNSFLPLCMSTFTNLAPRFAPDNKRFDLGVLMSSLLVNLVERCNSNRRKVIELMVPVYNIESGSVSQQPSLNALTQIFLMHESAARTVDEELDRDLILEDAPDETDAETDNNSDEDDGRLHRLPAELTEDEMIATVQRAMNKASAHMEDSVLASYTALLIGCLMQQNEEIAAEVKAQMPDGKLTPMVEQLQRFLDFMKISNIRSSGNRSVERIIDLLDHLNG